MKKGNLKIYILLYTNIIIYSLGSLCSKLASGYPFLSVFFILYYGFTLLSLSIYVLLWQQVLKVLPLTVAYSNKSITIILGMLWGVLIFEEQIRLNMIFGSLIIIAGVWLVVESDE